MVRKKLVARPFKEIKVVKNVEIIVIFREENLCNVVINSYREAMPLNNCLKKIKTKKGKKKSSLIITLTRSDNLTIKIHLWRC